MRLLDAICEAGGFDRAALAGRLGVAVDAPDAEVAGAIAALRAELERLAGSGACEIAGFVLDVLGLAPEADARDAKAALIRLGGRADMSRVARRLGLPADADDGRIMDALNDLQAAAGSREAAKVEKMVDRAVEGGLIEENQRSFWLENARRMPEATRRVLAMLKARGRRA
ncbi:MAG: hypothetical protein ACOC7T_03375 [Planctomycetota bacterium]